MCGNMKKCLACFIAILALSANAFACPSKNGITDYNCDGKVVISVIGDSIAYGIGDSANAQKGGYVLRTSKQLSNIQVNNLGVPGLRSQQLLQTLKKVFKVSSDSEWKDSLRESDIVVLDLGRNDRWLFGFPGATYRNLKKAATQIKNKVTELEGFPPLVVISVLMLPNRGSQGPWVKELNDIILKNSTLELPSDLRFDLVSKRLLSEDQIHPTSAGYKKLTATFVKYLTKALPPRMKKLRPDTDIDGLPDIFETNKYSTDPAVADTDGDLKIDGDEVFVYKTDPLVAD
jgi:lysophospholipase L1-like esterase